MDWTGGTYRRYAGRSKGNAVLQKQKAHFARVQAQKQQPFETPDFLRDAIASRAHQPLMSSSRHLTSQRSTDDRSLKSMSHHKRSHSGGKTSSSKRHRTFDDLNEKAPVSGASGRYERDPTGKKHGKAMSGASPPPTTMTDEERLLLANRKRLLARDDWLGLSAARPLRMKFPAASDKANIGKRRKVHKSKDQKARPARQRSHTPLFRQALRPRDGSMSNVEQDLDMQIKIGTDAFATQTQTSRRSHTPANTSMRQPSTEFESISEESMLLGVDGNGFEVKTDQGEPLQHLRDAYPTLQTDFTGPSYDFVAPPVSMAPTFQLSQDSEPMSTVPGWHHPQSQSMFIDDSRDAYDSHKQYAVGEDAEQEDHNDLESRQPHTLDTQTGSMQTDSEDDDDDETFRTLMKADATFSGKSSVAAVASSSYGIRPQPASLANMWPQPVTQATRTPQVLPDLSHPDILVPRSDSVVAERAETTRSEQYGPAETETSVAFGSPSNSLRQLYRTTSRPAETTQMPAEPPNEDEEEALWRSIYLRSQSSDSASSDLAETVQKTWLAKSDGVIEPANYSSSSKARTEKVLSDKATFGGSVSAAYQDSDSQPDEDAESKLSQHQTNTSMIGHATTVAPELNDIDGNDEDEEEEGSHPEPRSFTTGNIHATSTMSPNYHKRFSKRKQSTRPPFEKTPRFAASKARGARQEASTYIAMLVLHERKMGDMCWEKSDPHRSSVTNDIFC